MSSVEKVGYRSTSQQLRDVRMLPTVATVAKLIRLTWLQVRD